MDTYSPYDLTSAFEAACRAARDTGSCRYVVQTAIGYQVKKDLGLHLYNAWKINADGSIDDELEIPDYLPMTK